MMINVPILYTEVSKRKEFSPAIRNGVIKIDNKEYMYVRSKDALIVKDYIAKYKERKDEGEEWEEFVEFANNNSNGVKI
jgi:hypothetical protein